MTVSDRTARLVLTIDRLALNLARHWLLYVNVIFGVLVLTPFAAPLLMRIGATAFADAIYFIYSFLCHQLPQRSYFIFGPKISYSLAEIGTVWQSDDILTLRQFIGNSAMGWKVAWSDRMVSMYGSLWVGGLLYALLRKKLPRLSPLAWLFLGIMPMGLDGLSHTLNDALTGISGTGFRDTNAWLQVLTGNIFPASFYAGDAFGSFNNLARGLTGLLTGLATIWFIYPFVDDAMHDVAHQAQSKLASPRAIQLGFGEPGSTLPQEAR
jgi:uncharacterized membrane protein